MKGRVAVRPSSWLSLAAAPTFALMGLLTAITGDAHAALLCSESGEPSPFAGMTPMYLLMALFHLTPWIGKLAPRG